MGYYKQIGYDLLTQSRKQGLPFLDGVLWQWILYQNGNWAGMSPFYFDTEVEAKVAGLVKIQERSV